MYTVHLDTLGIVHNFQWIGFLYLTLSDISADILTLTIKKAEPFLTLPLTYCLN
jgi:hypothetical protein